MKIYKIIAIIGIATFANQVYAKTYGTAVVTEVTSVHDGDTFRANIDGWHPIIGKEMPIRVSGIDTPELRGKCVLEKQLAKKAKEATYQILKSANKIELKNIRRGRFFRLIADVFVDGKSLGDQLIHQKLAVKYHGGKRVNWCQ